MKKTLTILTLLTIAQLSVMGQTKVIAHRGAWKNTESPQNSLASLNHAIDQKTWGSEFDVQLTKDDVLVINHDDTFYGMDIATSTYAELLAIKHPNGENIPTAEDYLKEGLKQSGTKLIFELKTNRLGMERTMKAAKMSVDLVKKLHAEEQIVYIAFSYDACLKLRELDPKATIQYLNGDKSPKEIKEAGLNGLDYHISVYKKHPEWVAEAQSLGLGVNVWTVNKEADLQYFIAQKVDFITTNEPELLHKLLTK